jgi:hypothetical protein
MNSPDTSSTDLVRPRTPSLLFDEAWYLARYPDAAASEHDPLSYYLDVGDAVRRINNREEISRILLVRNLSTPMRHPIV